VYIECVFKVFVDQMTSDIVAVTRHSPETHESVILVAYTSFGYPDPCAGPGNLGKLRFEGNLQEIIFEATIRHRAGRRFDRPFSYKKNEHFLNGIEEYSVKLCEHIKLNESDIFRKTPIQDQHYTELEFENFHPGSVIAIK
jgi:glycogen debranching enzyme